MGLVNLSPLSVPVLLIVWRRPQVLLRLIEALRVVEPSWIFVASDGPTDDADSYQRVQSCRDIIDRHLTWPCAIERFYSNDNHGCQLGPLRAIDWFFSRVDSGIILEEDCLPHPDFFSFCSLLLDRYRDDPRVWCISGNNYLKTDRHVLYSC